VGDSWGWDGSLSERDAALITGRTHQPSSPAGRTPYCTPSRICAMNALLSVVSLAAAPKVQFNEFFMST